MDKDKIINPYDIEKEKSRRKELYIKLIVALFIDEYCSLITTHIFPPVIKKGEKRLKEVELQYLLLKEKNKEMTFKYDSYIMSTRKEEYHTDYYSKFISQREFIRSFSHFFLKDT
jgi:hypothetical protein